MNADNQIKKEKKKSPRKVLFLDLWISRTTRTWKAGNKKEWIKSDEFIHCCWYLQMQAKVFADGFMNRCFQGVKQCAGVAGGTDGFLGRC